VFIVTLLVRKPPRGDRRRGRLFLATAKDRAGYRR